MTDTDTNTARRFLRSLFAAIEEQLVAGESVTIKGIGTFHPSSDHLVASGEPVLFIPDEELAAAVNAPFDMFEPVVIADGLTFEEEPEEPQAAEAAEAVVPEVPESSDEPVQSGESDESDTTDEYGFTAEAAPEAPAVEAAVEAPAPAHRRYMFPEEEEGELPPDEPLRAPVQKSNRMWIWILLIVVAGGLIGYLFALLDSDEDVYGTDTEYVDEVPEALPDTTMSQAGTFEEVAVEELAAAAPAPVVAPAPAETPAEPAVAEPAPKPAPKAEEPVYDTVTGTNYLAKMARKYYGRSSYWVFIYQANTNVLDNPDRIKPGTRVLIPPKSSFAEASDEATRKKADRLRAELDKKYKK